MRSPVRARFLRLLGSSHYADMSADVLAEQQQAYYGVAAMGTCMEHGRLRLRLLFNQF